MADSRQKHPKEFQKKLVELVDSGRSVESLAREFDLPAQTIRNWVRAALREENRRLQKEIRRMEMEIEILKKADAWFNRDTGSTGDMGSSVKRKKTRKNTKRAPNSPSRNS